MRKLSLLLVFLSSVLCTPASAKTFVGVLWPMFGPLPAIGLVELVAELKMMPDVEVSTYLHQNWPALVDDIERQPAGTRTVVVGYSLGANSSVFVANKAKYVDVIIALQPSMLSWNPAVTGRVGRMIEVYNPNPLMTFGGMGSKKLIGPNIEYIENNDSHPGAQFNLEFRTLVKSEITRVGSESNMVAARIPTPGKSDDAIGAMALAFAKEQPETPRTALPGGGPAKAAAGKQQSLSNNRLAAAATTLAATNQKPEPPRPQEPTKLATAKAQAPAHGPQLGPQHGPPLGPQDTNALLDTLTSAIDSGNLFVARRLTVADMVDYANRNYGTSRTAEAVAETYQYR